MPATFKRLFQLTSQELFLFLKAGAIATFYSTIIFIFPFRFYAKWLGEKGKSCEYTNDQTVFYKAKTIERAMLRVKRYFPFRIKCLARALAAKYLLKKQKIPSTIYLGVAKENSEKITAHAWLDCCGITVSGKEEKQKFKSLVYFS